MRILIDDDGFRLYQDGEIFYLSAATGEHKFNIPEYKVLSYARKESFVSKTSYRVYLFDPSVLSPHLMDCWPGYSESFDKFTLISTFSEIQQKLRNSYLWIRGEWIEYSEWIGSTNFYGSSYQRSNRENSAGYGGHGSHSYYYSGSEASPDRRIQHRSVDRDKYSLVRRINSIWEVIRGVHEGDA